MDTPRNPLPATRPLSQESSQSEHSRNVARQIGRLLNHYWTDNDHLATRQAQIEDWLADLGEFPAGAIEAAIITWRRNERRRPTPADIRKLILPDPPKQDEGGGSALKQYPQSRLSLAQLQKHRNAIAPLWDLVRRAKAGEDPDMLIAERRRLSAEMFERAELREINEIIKQEEAAEKARR
jgi:hypothetical protein